MNNDLKVGDKVFLMGIVMEVTSCGNCRVMTEDGANCWACRTYPYPAERRAVVPYEGRIGDQIEVLREAAVVLSESVRTLQEAAISDFGKKREMVRRLNRAEDVLVGILWFLLALAVCHGIFAGWITWEVLKNA